MDASKDYGGISRMKILQILLLSWVLAGCAANPPVEILVPVAAPIEEPPVIEQPYLPIWLLSDDDSDDTAKISRYYVKSLYLQRLHSDKLQCALDAYRITTTRQCPIKTEE